MFALIRFRFDVLTKETREKTTRNDDDRKHLYHPVKKRQSIEVLKKKKYKLINISTHREKEKDFSVNLMDNRTSVVAEGK